MPANNEQILSLLQQAYAGRTNDLDGSISMAEEALRKSIAGKHILLKAKALNHLSLFHMIKGHYAQSEQLANDAIAIYKSLKDEKGIADAKYNIAGIYYKTDNFHMGLIYLIDCLATYRKFGDNHNRARVQKSLGTIYEYFGDEKNAINAYEDSIEAAQSVGDKALESNAYNPLSGIYLKRGDIDGASSIIDKAIAMKEETGDVRGLAFSLYGRAKVRIHRKDFKGAEADLLKALEIHERMGEKLGAAMANRKLGSLYLQTARRDEAKKTFTKLCRFCELYNVAIIRIKCLYHLYTIYKEDKDIAGALQHLEEYISLKESVINAQTLQVIENYELLKKMELMEKEAAAEKERAEIMEKKNLAEKASKMKQDFLSTMSHEIRTPLNAVLTISSILKERADAEDRELLESLRFAGGNLLNLVNDILDFTKLETGKERLVPQPVHFKTLLEQVRKTFDSAAKEKGLKLFLNIDAEVAEVYNADDTKLSQILSNLLSNAIKYTDDGRIDIEVEKTGEDHGLHLLKFVIRDTGMGIAAAHLHTIFDSFSQPHAVTTRKQGGSGLGLAIVKKLVELHGSHIRVKSVPGTGSEFYFELKLKPASPAAEAPATPAANLQGRCVLLAEDNMLNAMVAIKLLSNWGIKTIHAKNGKEAVEQAGTQSFDFILMDIHMPEMNGFEATKNIRETSNPNNAKPIFALTADVTAEHQEEYAGYFNGFLKKPIEIKKMQEALAGI